MIQQKINTISRPAIFMTQLGFDICLDIMEAPCQKSLIWSSWDQLKIYVANSSQQPFYHDIKNRSCNVFFCSIFSRELASEVEKIFEIFYSYLLFFLCYITVHLSISSDLTTFQVFCYSFIFQAHNSHFLLFSHSKFIWLGQNSYYGWGVSRTK